MTGDRIAFERRAEALREDIVGARARSESDSVVLSDEHVAFRWLDRDEAGRAADELPGGLAGETTRELLERFARGEL